MENVKSFYPPNSKITSTHFQFNKFIFNMRLFENGRTASDKGHEREGEEKDKKQWQEGEIFRKIN